MDISYSELRQNLKQTINAVNETHAPYVVTSNKKPCAVLLSYDDYQSLEETVYLLQSPAMAKRLLEAMEDVKAGKVGAQGLIENET
jgi:antitoxin YefM